MATKKSRAKKPAAAPQPVEVAAGETFEALMNATVQQRADDEERATQSHLSRRAWQLYGNLIMKGVFDPPERKIGEAVDDERATFEMGDEILSIIDAIVLSFEAGGYGPHGDEEF